MDKDYIEVKIPILDSVDEMKVVKTFNQEQLWFVCAIAKAFEKSEQQCKRQKEVIDRIDKYIKENIYSYYDSKGEKCIEETVFERSANPKELLDILKEVSEWIKKIYIL